ncbi:IS110 family transposase [Nonomuraea sp. SYSU D8015]|uniref:IS110 family transposase n=1 Tax=Nonomuraea sp. SYSU D8015 TaxID=2593644 RepID=UPI001CB73F19|nr:IS110 family transposase [Nonomuraea sp. SYSU D8015]
MVVIGIDAHKRTHTLVAVDQVGRKLAERTVRATAEGHADIAAWAAQWPTVLWRSRTAGMSADGWKAIYCEPAIVWCGSPPS